MKNFKDILFYFSLFSSFIIMLLLGFNKNVGIIIMVIFGIAYLLIQAMLESRNGNKIIILMKNLRQQYPNNHDYLQSLEVLSKKYHHYAYQHIIQLEIANIHIDHDNYLDAYQALDTPLIDSPLFNHELTITKAFIKNNNQQNCPKRFELEPNRAKVLSLLLLNGFLIILLASILPVPFRDDFLMFAILLILIKLICYFFHRYLIIYLKHPFLLQADSKGLSVFPYQINRDKRIPWSHIITMYISEQPNRFFTYYLLEFELNYDEKYYDNDLLSKYKLELKSKKIKFFIFIMYP